MKFGSQYGCGVQSNVVNTACLRSNKVELTELSNVHNIVLVLQDCSLVVVHIKVVGCAENRHDTGEPSSPRLPIHAVTCILRFVSANDGEQIVLLEEGACSGV